MCEIFRQLCDVWDAFSGGGFDRIQDTVGAGLLDGGPAIWNGDGGSPVLTP